jgi:hypothetical protein
MISRYQLIGNLICGTVLSGINTSYILSICNVAVIILSHTTLCQATILRLSYSILLNPCNIFSHLTNQIPTFCIPTKEQIVFGVTERLQYWQNCFLPPTSSMHILHHFCCFINLLIVENFFKHHIWGISGLSIIILHTCHFCYHQWY